MIALVLAMQASAPRVVIVDPEREAKVVAASSQYRNCLERYAMKVDDHVSEASKIGAAVASRCDRQATQAAEAIIQNSPGAMRERLLSIFRKQRLWEATATVLGLRSRAR